jgi:hypothetical protein
MQNPGTLGGDYHVSIAKGNLYATAGRHRDVQCRESDHEFDVGAGESDVSMIAGRQ